MAKKNRTPECIRHSVQGCFGGCLGGGGIFGSSLPKHKKNLNREADEVHLSNYITPGKLIPKIRSITLHPGN